MPEQTLEKIAELCLMLKTDGLRGELSLSKAARACAALDGRQLNIQFFTALIFGKTFTKALIAVDFPVPRWPITKTPPMSGSTADSFKAKHISSCPIIAVKG